MVKSISAEEFDRKFDDGEDISEYLDWSTARRVNDFKKVAVDLPLWMVEALDKEAYKIGISPQDLIKVIINEYLRTRS